MCLPLSLAGFALFLYTVTRCQERHREPHSNHGWKFVHIALLSLTNASRPGKVYDQTQNIICLHIDQYFDISLLYPCTVLNTGFYRPEAGKHWQYVSLNIGCAALICTFITRDTVMTQHRIYPGLFCCTFWWYTEKTEECVANDTVSFLEVLHTNRAFLLHTILKPFLLSFPLQSRWLILFQRPPFNQL